jgi:hypothetical protein
MTDALPDPAGSVVPQIVDGFVDARANIAGDAPPIAWSGLRARADRSRPRGRRARGPHSPGHAFTLTAWHTCGAPPPSPSNGCFVVAVSARAFFTRRPRAKAAWREHHVFPLFSRHDIPPRPFIVDFEMNGAQGRNRTTDTAIFR